MFPSFDSRPGRRRPTWRHCWLCERGRPTAIAAIDSPSEAVVIAADVVLASSGNHKFAFGHAVAHSVLCCA